MKLQALRDELPQEFYDVLKEHISDFRPSQQKAITKGLLKGKNLLVCTPTASGKTLIAELAAISSILNGKGKAIYIVPLKALASEKFKDFKKRYGHLCKIALSIGDIDAKDPFLVDYDFIICTAEKLDSLIRHSAPWLKFISTVVVDEIHLLNDPSRGPTLEILLTILRQLLPKVQILGLSATIGNPEELADWLDAKLVFDTWRPVELKQGILFENEITYVKK